MIGREAVERAGDARDLLPRQVRQHHERPLGIQPGGDHVRVLRQPLNVDRLHRTVKYRAFGAHALQNAGADESRLHSAAGHCVDHGIVRTQVDQLHITRHPYAHLLELVGLRHVAAQESRPPNADAAAFEVLERARRPLAWRHDDHAPEAFGRHPVLDGDQRGQGPRQVIARPQLHVVHRVGHQHVHLTVRGGIFEFVEREHVQFHACPEAPCEVIAKRPEALLHHGLRPVRIHGQSQRRRIDCQRARARHAARKPPRQPGCEPPPRPSACKSHRRSPTGAVGSHRPSARSFRSSPRATRPPATSTRFTVAAVRASFGAAPDR